MSSDLFMFEEGSYYPDEISGSNFITDPISALSDSSIDSFLQEIIEDPNNSKTQVSPQKTHQISPDDAQSLDQITHTLFSDSPPSNQLDSLSLQQQQEAHLGNLRSLTNSSSLGNVYSNNNNNNNYSSGIPEVKTEEFHLGFDLPSHSSDTYNSYFLNGGGENMLKFMQRSYSSNSFEGKPGFLLKPGFDTLLEIQDFNPDTETAQMRRVCSTGDLPKIGVNQQTTCGGQQTTICSSSSPLSGEGSNFIEEANFKVGRYSAEERRERIDRYRAKRTQRNFNKTIKYACRKTLADNRPRIRGRFARNDETGEIPKPTCFNRYEDDDDLWVDSLQEEDQRILGRGGRFLSNFGATQFQYCGY